MATLIRKVALLSPTGKFGPFLLKALQDEGFQVTAIIRKSSKGEIPPNVGTVRVGDDYPEDEVVSAFKGHDAVVLSLANSALDKALSLADASVKAGVHRLIGSFYGGNVEDRSQDFFPLNVAYLKQIEHLRKLQQDSKNWSWTAIATGPFTDLLAQVEMYGIHPSTKTAELLDGGEKRFTTSTRTQSALAAARVLRNLDETENKLIFVASFEKTLVEYLGTYKLITGAQDWRVTSISSAELKADSLQKIASGNMFGLGGLAIAASAGQDHKNHHSEFATLANGYLDLPEEKLEDVLKKAMADGFPGGIHPEKATK